ncbi:hypothetical protein [Oerskovia paurometabola]|uniref:hypothetical protein n=1 Tax=Oerskovia paurometabola TaxID=162170 RepID=UPI0034174189
MTDARTWLDQVDARTNAAMPGPWEVRDREIRDRDNLVVGTILRPANAEFIAHARTDLPTATAALRAVLDLHRPQAPGGNLVGDDFCHGCWEAGGCDAAPLYPCPTVTAITTALEDA